MDRDSFIARNIADRSTRPLIFSLSSSSPSLFVRQAIRYPYFVLVLRLYASISLFLRTWERERRKRGRGGEEEKKKVINRARREITIISAFVPSGVYIDFCRREAVGIESRLWMDGYGDAKATFGTVIVITIGP